MISKNGSPNAEEQEKTLSDQSDLIVKLTVSMRG